MIHPILHLINLSLSYIREIRPLRKEPPNNAIRVFIATSFPGAIRMAIIDFSAVLFHTVIISELRAIINRDALEALRKCSRTELLLNLIKDTDHCFHFLIGNLIYELITALSLRENQERSRLTLLTADTIHFPMPELRPIIDILRTLVNGGSFNHLRRSKSFILFLRFTSQEVLR